MFRASDPAMKSASWIITFDLLSSNVMSNSSNKLGFGFLFFCVLYESIQELAAAHTIIM